MACTSSFPFAWSYGQAVRAIVALPPLSAPSWVIRGANLSFASGREHLKHLIAGSDPRKGHVPKANRDLPWDQGERAELQIPQHRNNPVGNLASPISKGCFLFYVDLKHRVACLDGVLAPYEGQVLTHTRKPM